MVYFVIYSQVEVRIVVEHFVTDGESYGMVRYVESPRVANPDRIFVPIAVELDYRMILLIISVPMSSRVIHRLRKATTRETHRMLYRGCSV